MRDTLDQDKSMTDIIGEKNKKFQLFLYPNEEIVFHFTIIDVV